MNMSKYMSTDTNKRWSNYNYRTLSMNNHSIIQTPIQSITMSSCILSHTNKRASNHKMVRSRLSKT